VSAAKRGAPGASEREKGPSTRTGLSPLRLGGGLLLLLLGGVAATELLRAPEEGAAPPLPPLPTELSGFLPEAWFLPDDPFLGFVEIPEGGFLMGSDPARDPGAFENERWSQGDVQGWVELPTYYLGRYEVTVAQYRAFLEATGRRGEEASLRLPFDHPVSGVSWTDALAYARWLEGGLRGSALAPAPLRELLLAGWAVNLPSEAEWEKGARGTDGRVFPWGDQLERGRANAASRGSVPVGSYPCPECPYSLADMAGNLWEWTRSPLQPYPFEPSDLPVDRTVDALRVMRGGSFSDPESFLRSALRGGADPGVRRPFLGFRLALVPPAATR